MLSENGANSLHCVVMLQTFLGCSAASSCKGSPGTDEEHADDDGHRPKSPSGSLLLADSRYDDRN